ncbi:MAG: hypothetical protein K2K53_09700, partial [Oscillospiraceae bacterium]|nr:hypothetical protein [Oscillospiraceae bacterium]
MAAGTGVITVGTSTAEVTTTLAEQNEYIVGVEASLNYSGMRTVKLGDTVHENQPDSERSYAYLWGRNNRGQLGLGDTRNRYVPARVVKGEYEEHNTAYTYLEGVYDLSLGTYHALSINMYLKNGTEYEGDGILDGRFGYVWGWGNNATDASGTTVLGQLSNMVDAYLVAPVVAGRRESMELMIDYMEAVTYDAKGQEILGIRMAYYNKNYVTYTAGTVATAYVCTVCGETYDSSNTTLDSDGWLSCDKCGHWGAPTIMNNTLNGDSFVRVLDGQSVVSANSGMKAANVMPTVPPQLTLGANEKLTIYKENTHLHYDNGFALYPFAVDLKSTTGAPGESWSIVSSNS